jgi:predicted nucleic acid-binding protein
MAVRNSDDLFHERGRELMRDALRGEFDRVYTSDYIIDEAITTALMRTKRHDLAVDVGKYIIEYFCLIEWSPSSIYGYVSI